jgi:hypothetical protein
MDLNVHDIFKVNGIYRIINICSITTHFFTFFVTSLLGEKCLDDENMGSGCFPLY